MKRRRVWYFKNEERRWKDYKVMSWKQKKLALNENRLEWCLFDTKHENIYTKS